MELLPHHQVCSHAIAIERPELHLGSGGYVRWSSRGLKTSTVSVMLPEVAIELYIIYFESLTHQQA